MRWNVLFPDKVNTLEQLNSALLSNRGISDQDEFFNPPSPLALSMADVGLSTEAVAQAVSIIKAHRDKKILVFGDYDADGICATAVMWLTLHNLGYQVLPFIPHRSKHGYGISHKALDEILNDSPPDLVISVDNGIVAHQPIERLRAAGIDVIVTDHHQPEAKLPSATAIVHTTQLCGTTVAWMLAREILQASLAQTPAASRAEGLLDLCGIATIADQVPLLKANRSFALFGVKALQTTNRPGIKALCLIAGSEISDISAETVNFTLAPRINAMGRLDHGLDALRLVCTGNLDKATQLANTLQVTNLRRQGLTDTMLKEAELQAEKWLDQHLIVVASPSYHEGVIGLIAGRLTEKYHKPAIAIAIGEETAKASARSVVGVNVVELIRMVKEDLLEVGGHPMAAGFGLLSEKVELVMDRLSVIARTEITADLLTPTLSVDCEIDTTLLTLELADLLQKFEPFGQANPKPMFKICGIKILDQQAIGKNQQHLKLLISDEDQTVTVTALGWNMGHLAAGGLLRTRELCATVEVNTWKNRTQLQLHIKDFN